MTTITELKNNIITEFLVGNYAPVILTEIHGYISNIDAITDYFEELVSEQISETFARPQHTTTKTYKDNINLKTFFETFVLNITFNITDYNSYSGGLHDSSIYKDKDDNWVCFPNIILIINGKSIIDLHNIFKFVISHELTHCYDYLEYAKEIGETPFILKSRNNYVNVVNNLKNKDIDIASSAGILYLLDKIERNAYIAQIRQELIANQDKLTDWQSTFYIVKNTESYKKFLHLEKNVNAILSITDKKQQLKFIDALNKTMDKNFTTYNQLQKYYWGRWLKWKKGYLNKITKIAYDVYKDNPQNGMTDWEVNNNFPDVKIRN